MKLYRKVSITALALISSISLMGPIASADSSSMSESSSGSSTEYVIHGNNVKVYNFHAQIRGQNNPHIIRGTKKLARRKRSNRDWFRDGLSPANLRARQWIAWHESNDRWNVLSYGGKCIGYFQLDPSYLGYVNGHVNLNHKHQVKIADAYAKKRYGSWINAKAFWEAHNWY